MKNTDLNLIPIFVAIYEERNLSKSAERLGITQPAVSKALKRLRDIYNDSLFLRDSSAMLPTPRAMDIYPAMSAALSNYTSTINVNGGFDPATAERVYSFAVISGLGHTFLPFVFSHLRTLAPNIHFEIHPKFSKDTELDLRLQRYDFVIDAEHFSPSFINTHHLFDEEIVAIMNKDHPRINDEMTLAQFLAEEHTVVSGWQVRSSMMSSAHISELNSRKVAYRSSAITECLPIVEQTDLLALCSKAIVEKYLPIYDVKYFPLPLAKKHLSINLYWHPSRDNDPGHAWLKELLIQQGVLFKNSK
ncbi:LysR family transcriptional regulator [Psychromonas marina]|uniref:LysR family transcriptional regulator n=1 Tax=Psychromonas marina TaxID=88364 RepID=A0ABQ6E1R8_9GAMM|nr:LysR substrate-binding domain-containing protein [Psychromonas marina]GLS91163.1 LysR family transcriptional regulator [Psychromonas marina]